MRTSKWLPLFAIACMVISSCSSNTLVTSLTETTIASPTALPTTTATFTPIPKSVSTLTITPTNIPIPTISNIRANDSIEIYQLIIHKIYLQDNSFGKAVDVKYLYILKDTNDRAGDPRITERRNQRLTNEFMDGVNAKLSDLPSQTIWVNSYDDVLYEDNFGKVKDGACITLGNIRFESDTKAYASISIYFANLAAAGKTYILEENNGVWKIIGDTGVSWVS